jgi:3-oxoisoapionate decarboxylase
MIAAHRQTPARIQDHPDWDKKALSRRQALAALSVAGASLLLNQSVVARESESNHKGLGLVTYAFGIHNKNHWGGRHPGLSPALALLEEARELKAPGIQLDLTPDDAAQATELRRRTEAYGMYVEASFAPPKSEQDAERFAKCVLVAKAAGASLARTVILPGRRYEDFRSLEQFRKAEQAGLESLQRAEPILARERFRMAVENHKDQRIAEKLSTLKRLGSEWVGLCLDVGNSFTLMEDPVDVARAYAPYAFTVHFKDQAVRESEEGFEYADVPLGKGFIDLPKIVAIVRDARPDIHLNLELITRDALLVPMLRDDFWQTLRETPASDLAHILTTIKHHSAREPFVVVSKLPVEQQLALELENVRTSLAYARNRLGLT